jgi:predicted AAA+ superfamily ATPase
MKTLKIQQGIMLTLSEEKTFEEQEVKIQAIPVWKWLLGTA